MDLLVKQETVIDLLSSMTVLDGFTGRAGDSNRLMSSMTVLVGFTDRAGDSNRLDVFNDCP